MLVLTRKEGETVTIPLAHGQIVIGVTKCKHGKASLVIQAPEDLRVLRTELIFEEERPPMKTIFGRA